MLSHLNPCDKDLADEQWTTYFFSDPFYPNPVCISFYLPSSPWALARGSAVGSRLREKAVGSGQVVTRPNYRLVISQGRSIVRLRRQPRNGVTYGWRPENGSGGGVTYGRGWSILRFPNSPLFWFLFAIFISFIYFDFFSSYSILISFLPIHCNSNSTKMMIPLGVTEFLDFDSDSDKDDDFFEDSCFDFWIQIQILDFGIVFM